MSTAAKAVGELTAQLAGDPQVRLVDTTGRRDRSLSGVELAHEISQARNRLLHAGISGEHTVLFAIRPSVAAVTHMLALLSIGSRVVLIDLRDPARLIESKLAQVKPDFALTEPLLALASRKPVRRLRWFRGRVPPIAGMAKRIVTIRHPTGPGRTLTDPKPDDPALVVFTSGTTDTPKAVVHTQRTLAAMLKTLVELMDDAPGEVVYTDQFHSLFPSLVAGARCVFGRPEKQPWKLVQCLNQQGVRTWFTTPPVLRDVLPHLARGGTLTRVVLGSSPVTRPLVQEVSRQLPQVAVVAVYAMSEAVPVAITDGEAIVNHRGSGDLVGAPVPGLDVLIEDTGEIVISGVRVGSYLGSSEIAIRTGDHGYLTETGELVLEGRIKDMILTGARNIYPQHYEPHLVELEGVQEAALVGISDQYGDEELWLALELQPGANRDMVVLSVAGSDAGRSLPISGVVFTELPRSGRSRKLDRLALRHVVTKARNSEEFVRLANIA